MAVNGQRGPGIGLPTSTPLVPPLILAGQSLSAPAGPMSLAAGETFTIPAGQFFLSLGTYNVFQVKDPILGGWRTIQSYPWAGILNSDGTNMRVANLTGCTVGAFITNVGSGYTSAPTVTVSAGSSAWTAIVGGAVNSTVTITTAGVGYTHAPQLIVSAPPPGGIQATMTCTVSGGVINAVTVVNQGAGYTSAPTVIVIPDPRDTVTTAAVLTATLTGSGTITALVRTDHGTPLTSVPTFTFSGGGGSSAAATAVMAFVATGFTVGAGGAAYGNAQPFGVITTGGIVGGSAGAVVNPLLGPGIFTPRQANISGTSTAGGAITATGAVVNDGGLFQAVPNGLVIAGGSGLATTVGQVTITVGGVSDTFFLYPV